MKYKILSIDAWRNDEGWTWNNWFHVGDYHYSLDTGNRQILKMLRYDGYLSDYSKGRVSIEDDQYNIVIMDKNTRKPLFAIEYGDTI